MYQSLEKKLVKEEVRLLSKLWTFSVLLEPLLFFILADRTEAGISVGLSRIIQVFILILLLGHFCMGKTIRFKSYEMFVWWPFGAIIFYVVFVILINLLMGGYSVDGNGSENIGMVSIINTSFFRPVIELINLLYQYFYFIVLAPVFLRNRKEIDFFFRTAFIFVGLHFLIGWLDFFLVALTGFDFIPRHLSDMRGVGLRFHGLAGEPRDAAVYMLGLLFLYSIHSFYKKNTVELPTRRLIALILISVLATISVTGILAMIIALTFTILYSNRKINLKRIFMTLTIVVIMSVGIVVYLQTNERLFNYYEIYSSSIVQIFNNPKDLPPLILISFNNIYPIFVLIKEAINFNIFPLLFGGGLGGSGVVNAYIYGEINNPNSQMIRLLYEYGIFGMFFFLAVHMKVIGRCAEGLSINSRNILMYSALIMFGGVFAHRSSFYLILIGALCAVAVYKKYRFIDHSDQKPQE